MIEPRVIDREDIAECEHASLTADIGDYIAQLGIDAEALRESCRHIASAGIEALEIAHGSEAGHVARSSEIGGALATAALVGLELGLRIATMRAALIRAERLRVVR